jgi:hypothetical protein
MSVLSSNRIADGVDDDVAWILMVSLIVMLEVEDAASLCCKMKNCFAKILPVIKAS